MSFRFTRGKMHLRYDSPASGSGGGQGGGPPKPHIVIWRKFKAKMAALWYWLTGR